MKSSIISNLRPLLRALYAFFIAIAVLWAMPRNAQAQRLYVTQMPFFPLSRVGEVSEYDPHTGGLIKEDFIGALNNPSGLTVSGNTLFVLNFGADVVSKFDADTGAAINRAFITGVTQPVGLAVLGNTLFVVRTRARQGDVGKYDATTGAAINKDFLTKLDGPEGLAASGNALFVALQIP